MKTGILRCYSITLVAMLIGCSSEPPPATTTASDGAGMTRPDDAREADGNEEPATESDSPPQAASTTETNEEATANPAAARKKPNALEEISFDDLNLQLQADVVFRPWMLTDRAKELDGQKIRIAGYMLPFTQLEGIAQFVLLRNTECKFGPGGQPDHLLNVTLREGLTTKFRDKPIQVEGMLKVNPYQGPDGNTWYIYELNSAENIVVQRL